MATVLDMTCTECDAPLTGMQVKYCSEPCKWRAKGKRRHRKASRTMATAFTVAFHSSKVRSKSNGREFTLTRRDIPNQERCQRTGIPFDANNTLRAPSLDRVDNTRGYVPGNVEWVCWGYNLLKGDRTTEEVDQFLSEITL